VEWRRRGLDRLLVSELASVLELARAGGGYVDPAMGHRVDELRRATLDGREPDHAQVAALVDDADTLISTLEALRRTARSRESDGASGADLEAGRRSSRAAAAQPAATTAASVSTAVPATPSSSPPS